MNHTPAEMILKYIRDSGLATGWATTYAKMPVEPVNIISVFDNMSQLDGKIMRTGQTVEHPGIQVRVRSEPYKDGWLKAQAILESMSQMLRETIVLTNPDQVYKIQAFTVTGSLMYIGQAEKQQGQNFTFNGTISFGE